MSQSCIGWSQFFIELTSSMFNVCTILEYRQDDRQPHRRFSRRHHHHEEANI